MLCKANADVNVRDLIGRSPLWLAVSKDGHVSQVKALLRYKHCELNYADMREKRTALQVRQLLLLTYLLTYLQVSRAGKT